ncbi:hypothetical protein C8R44DRAFT_747366 [Mycena epipterygia]|nr:hypothetical protein C8R44DRAFT_747366 [Mycena epipterygia]
MLNDRMEKLPSLGIASLGPSSHDIRIWETKILTTEKTFLISLRNLLEELFTSDSGAIKNITNTYFGTGGAVYLLETAIGNKALKDTDIGDWIMTQATALCTWEDRLCKELLRLEHEQKARVSQMIANGEFGREIVAQSIRPRRFYEWV